MKTALSLQLNQTDRNDAQGLAQIVCTGWDRAVAAKSVGNPLIRSRRTTRAHLGHRRVDLIHQIRGVLQPVGRVVGQGGGQPFPERVWPLIANGPQQEGIEARLTAWPAIEAQIHTLSRHRVATARQDPAVRRLMTAPGVLVALT
jgi:transposase